MNRNRLPSVWGVLLLSLISPSAQIRVRAATAGNESRPLVSLQVPVDFVLSVDYTAGLQVRHDNLGGARIVGDVALQMQKSNGSDSLVRLQSPQSQAEITPPPARSGRMTRVLANPIDTQGIALEIPARVTASLEGAALFLDAANKTVRVTGPAIVRLSDGIRIMVRDTCLTVIERQATGDSRITIEAFTRSPIRP